MTKRPERAKWSETRKHELTLEELAQGLPKVPPDAL